MSALHLPETCGVMLLPDCTLFPHGGLPLRIFEPRYRKMLEDALEGSAFFAVTRLIGEETRNPADCVAEVGTIGLVRASHQQEDGTSQLLLHGVIRVKFTHWHLDKPYPYATIEPLITFFEPEAQAEAAVKTLRGAVEDAVRDMPDEVKQQVMNLIHHGSEPPLLTDIVAQQFIHDPDLRQQILETDSAGKRIGMICDYLRTVTGRG
ncbi:MAG: LON peptidase substrate-binding domain-containing protein [Luteolibacter sp.]